MSDVTEPQRTLDLGEAVVLLEKAIADKGADFVYSPEGTSANSANGCVYFKGGAPSCIVGHVISYMGLEYDASIEGTMASTALENLGVELDVQTRLLLNKVQDAQDIGTPWGEALNEARFGDDD